jgi:hypothetical protein
VSKREKDRVDFDNLIHRLEAEGREYGKDDTDALTSFLDGEKFPRDTREIVKEIVFIIEDNPEFSKMIPEKLMKFFSGYILPKKESKMTKAQRIIQVIEAMSDERIQAAEKAFSEYDFESDGVMVTDSDRWQEDGPDKLISKFYFDDMEGRKSDSSVFSVVFEKGTSKVTDSGPAYVG